jgi:D-alanyl-D-alanine dipeptidase
MKLLVLAVLAGCSSKPQTPSPSPPPIVITDAAVDAAAAKLVSANQVVTAIVPDWTSTRAELRLWQRNGQTWKLAMGPWQGVVGTSGTAWGIGVHGNGAPVGRSGPAKREGDGKSPAGVFALRGSFGYAKTASSTLPYQAVTGDWKCVDDPQSKHYNAILDKRTTTIDWKSAEEMRRKDDLYKWGVDVAHNPRATPGGGSCIFLHVWRDADSATVGCTAMEAQVLERLISRIDTTTMFVLLPRAEYAALAEGWGLP